MYIVFVQLLIYIKREVGRHILQKKKEGIIMKKIIYFITLTFIISCFSVININAKDDIEIIYENNYLSKYNIYENSNKYTILILDHKFVLGD